MRATPAPLLAHMALSVTYMCSCYRVTRRDNQIFGFTDHTKALTIDGLVYSPLSGFLPSPVPSSSGTNVSTVEVTGGFRGDALTDVDLNAGRWDNATVQLFEVNYNDVTLGKHRLGLGRIGEVSSDRFVFVAELRNLLSLMQQSIGELVLPTCPVELGSVRCGINLDTFPDGKVMTTVSSVTSRRQFTCSSLTQAAAWFSFGKVVFQAGSENTGLECEIRTHSGGGGLLLFEVMPFNVAIGDSVQVWAGCDKLKSGNCFSKYDNVINHQGFDDLPGLDRVVNGL